MPHAYTEDLLVEQPAIGLFAELGWAVAGPPPNAGVAGEPRDAGLLGRETKGEVVLVSRLRAALERLNPALPPEAITAAVDELTRDRSAMLLEQANREVYRLLKEGIPVSVVDTESTPQGEVEGRARHSVRAEWCVHAAGRGLPALP
jgi:type I restriction enzyme R subunit